MEDVDLRVLQMRINAGHPAGLATGGGGGASHRRRRRFLGGGGWLGVGTLTAPSPAYIRKPNAVGRLGRSQASAAGRCQAAAGPQAG